MVAIPRELRSLVRNVRIDEYVRRLEHDEGPPLETRRINNVSKCLIVGAGLKSNKKSESII